MLSITGLLRMLPMSRCMASLLPPPCTTQQQAGGEREAVLGKPAGPQSHPCTQPHRSVPPAARAHVLPAAARASALQGQGRSPCLAAQLRAAPPVPRLQLRRARPCGVRRGEAGRCRWGGGEESSPGGGGRQGGPSACLPRHWGPQAAGGWPAPTLRRWAPCGCAPGAPCCQLQCL